MSAFLQNHCDGSGRHSGPREVRLYPLGGGANLIMCAACFARENAYRRDRAREQGNPENWPQVEYARAEVYAREEA